MKKVMVVGGGTMGLDIAQVFARADFEVVVRDISVEIIKGAEERLNKGLDKLVSKGKLDEAGKKAITDKIAFTTELANAADADLVIEAAIENLKIKQSIFSELDTICKPETIFATNTSSMSITAIASATKRPDKFIGMHFFNPATVMKLIEVIKGANTSDETTAAIKELSVQIGKDPVEVNEAPGFVVNKLLVPMINEAIGLVETNVASVEDIDKAMKLGANHPMGPLALGDLIGLDVCLAIMEVLYAETGDPKYRACPLLRKMVRAGKLGRKSGQGFYCYNK
ncbi:MAG: 3-hydroxybutyryl-CoA dehydrogenase [Oscillospiraceae bacterium]|jgi:3-hydroxybutyryl-CoA dehydrogenase